MHVQTNRLVRSMPVAPAPRGRTASPPAPPFLHRLREASLCITLHGAPAGMPGEGHPFSTCIIFTCLVLQPTGSVFNAVARVYG